jgi:hypothetical protein
MFLKIFGLLVLAFGLLVTVVGVGGAAMNLVFPPEEMVCKMADDRLAKTQQALKDYEAAKGTDLEYEKKRDLESALSISEGYTDSCARAKDSHRFYGLVFSGVAVVGVVILLFGAVLTFFGFRKKKLT